MRGVFGILLVGGGVILMYGLFTGKIQFPGGAGIGNPLAPGGPINSPTNPNPPGTNNIGNGKGWINPNSDGSCPSGTHVVHVSGGKLACQYN